jgi:hypothetical protein
MDTVDWERVRENAHAQNAAPPEWPVGVAPISNMGLALLGIDRKWRLYGDGHPVEMRYRLTFWQSLGALVVGTSVVVASIATVVQAWAAVH